MPPTTTSAPAVDDVVFVLLAILNVPVTVRVELKVAAPVTSRVDLKVTAPVTPKPPLTNKAWFILTLPPIPMPPVTINAPVVVEVDSVELVMLILGAVTPPSPKMANNWLPGLP